MKKQYTILSSAYEKGENKVLFLKRLDIQMVKTSCSLFYLT